MIRTAQPEKPPREKELTCGIYAEPRMVRDLLAAWLSVRGGIRVVMRSGRVTDARRTVIKQKPDLLIVAVPANLTSTLDVIGDFLSCKPSGKVIVVGSGAAGFSPPQDIAGSILGVFDLTSPLQGMWGAIEKQLIKPKPAGVASVRRRMAGSPLSPQESRILGLIGDGQTSRAIAEAIGISEHTVRAHRKRIITKLGTAGTNLTHWAVVLRHGGKTAVVDGESS